MNLKKIAVIPITWTMQATVKIPYVHPEELAELIKNMNLPKGEAVSGSLTFDSSNVDSYNSESVTQDILTALDDLK